MDNERPIEKLLRRFAKKRRDETGTPPELHPATRRLLHGEVTRQFGKERSGQATSVQAPRRWWPRLAFGLSVIVVVAAILLPTLNKSKPSFSETASGDSQKEADLAFRTRTDENADKPAAPVEIAKNEAVLSITPEQLKLEKSTDGFGMQVTNEGTLAFTHAARPESSGFAVLKGGSAAPVMEPVPGAIAATPAMVPPSVAFYEDKTNMLAVSERRTATTGLSLSPAGINADVETPHDKTAGEGRVNSISQSQKAAAYFSNTQKSDSKTPVLSSFQVEQDGDELRMVDSDGSTYAGTIVPVSGLTTAEKEFSKGKYGETSRARTATGGVAGDSSYKWNGSGQNTYFRVSGTNKTLKQQVVFTGNFIQATNAAQSQLLDLRVANQVQTFSNLQAFPSLLNNSVIVGRAQLEKDNAVEVNAEQVFQK